MGAKISAGMLMYRYINKTIEVLLAHPGGPLYENKDHGYWGIPKGELEKKETAFAAAIREFTEETGFAPCYTSVISLGSVTEPSGKTVHIWAFEGNCNTCQPVNSNQFFMEWPANSGLIHSFPEVDRIQFFSLEAARTYIELPQLEFLFRLDKQLRDSASPRPYRAATSA